MGRPDGLIAIFVGDGTRRHKDVTGAWRAARLIILTSVVEAGCSYDNLEISLYQITSHKTWNNHQANDRQINDRTPTSTGFRSQISLSKSDNAVRMLQKTTCLHISENQLTWYRANY